MWHSTLDLIPKVGELVLILRLGGEFLPSVGSIETDDDGETYYWASESDQYHGFPVEHVTHWASIPKEPSI